MLKLDAAGKNPPIRQQPPARNSIPDSTKEVFKQSWEETLKYILT